MVGAQPPAVGGLVAGTVAVAHEGARRPGSGGERSMEDAEEDGQPREAYSGDQSERSMSHASTVAATSAPRGRRRRIGGQRRSPATCEHLGRFRPVQAKGLKFFLANLS